MAPIARSRINVPRKPEKDQKPKEYFAFG